VFSVFGVFSVLCFAVVACVGLDCELSVFPCFGGFGVFFFAVWTLACIWNRVIHWHVCGGTIKRVSSYLFHRGKMDEHR